ncbi:hypothetical protein PGT21_019269 [Puccinia graminis f. sp. tritici]|uniref:Uncharacterized protein n=1 Tax=Puccinia graminis f. sp. tritici TaxID=56615 RepID=A0A5B0LPA7_PUCGR|nr:hypothetical protein PGT21_019269 [Puccinia graminis f. sp. tritici]KAA1130312.1 hypothetical protein PGTUg99_015032 [Puccinia graminis f. sp. tritici]
MFDLKELADKPTATNEVTIQRPTIGERCSISESRPANGCSIGKILAGHRQALSQAEHDEGAACAAMLSRPRVAAGTA